MAVERTAKAAARAFLQIEDADVLCCQREVEVEHCQATVAARQRAAPDSQQLGLGLGRWRQGQAEHNPLLQHRSTMRDQPLAHELVSTHWTALRSQPPEQRVQVHRRREIGRNVGVVRAPHRQRSDNLHRLS
jgi:hypothetical protein